MKQIYYVFQTLLRGRGSNVIKIISLGLGLTMSILLFSRVAYEQSFDTCFKDYDNLYQAWSVFTVKGEQLKPQRQNCGPLVGAILENFPKEVESATSLCNWFSYNPLYQGEARFDGEKIAADSLFFRTMGIKVLSGDPEKELTQPNVIFLSEGLARRVFGEENPIGKQVNYNYNMDLTVKGTYADIPENATLRPEAVISLPTVWSRGMGNYSWSGGDSWIEYIRFREGADKEVVNQRLDAMIQKYRPDEDKKNFGYTAFVKPIRDTYRENEDVRRMRNIMTVLGFAILFIVTLNYVLMAVSSMSYRAKMVGVHKCSGASGGGIFGMFLLETAVIIAASLLLMILLMFNFRDFVEDTAAAKLSMLLAPERIWVALSVIAVLFLVGGVLPGRLFANIPVSQVFRRYTEGKKGWKRPLLFVQFAGVAFISGLMYVVMAQYQYAINKDMGYNPQRLVVCDELHPYKQEGREAALSFFKGQPYVEAVSSAGGTPIQGYSGTFIKDDADQALFSSRACYYMREEFPEMMGMTLLEGRMARDYQEIVVNETFVEMMHWGKEVLGRTVNTEGKRFNVVGLLKDFHIQDLTAEQMPFLAHGNDAFSGTIHVRLKEPFSENLKRLNADVKEAFPGKTVDFWSYEGKIAECYNSVRVFRNATLMAALTMFFVMLMGLIGYTTDEVRRRSKEIAIRKVNGAEAGMILELLSRDVLYVAVPAVLLGTVASWYVNDLWMDQFAERIPMNWSVYPLIAVANLAVIVGCVLWKSWRIANENPVLSIKSE